MALPTNPNANGATPSTDSTVVDAELADWVYHRAEKDQGLGLREIDANASIYVAPIKELLQHEGYSVGYDGFIYNRDTGFCCAVVDETHNNYAIVVRGTDFGSGSFWDLSKALGQSLLGDPKKLTITPKLDAHDIYQDVWQGEGLYGQATQVQDVLNVVAALRSAQPGANIRLVGQSLGGGDAGAASVAAGLPSDVFDPAPFRNQADVQLLLSAAASVGVTDLPLSRISMLKSIFLNLRQKNAAASTIGSYVREKVGEEGWISFCRTYEDLVRRLDDPANHTITRIAGELLSSAPFTWTQLGRVYPLVGHETTYDVGYDANGGIFNGAWNASVLSYQISIHSSSLLALVAASQQTPYASFSFDKLMKADRTLYDAFIMHTGNSGALTPDPSQARSDDFNAAGSSKVDGGEPDPGILLRALLKTAGDPHGLYAYFSTLFGSTFNKGVVAPASGLSDDPDPLHEAFERLALDVFRDRVARTSTVDDLYSTSTKGGNILSAVGGSGGQPLADAVIIHRSDVTATSASQLDSLGLQYGERPLDTAVWNDIRAAVGSDQEAEQLLGRRHDKIFGGQILQASLMNAIFVTNTPAQGLPWDIAVAQAGSDAGSFKFDPNDASTGARNGDADKNLLIFGGKGTNDIKGGNKNDIIVAGDGKTTVEASQGNAIIVAGKGVTMVNVGSGSNTIVGGSGNLVVNALTQTGTSKGGTEIVLGGTGNCTFNLDCSIKSGPSAVLLEGGTGENTFNVDNGGSATDQQMPPDYIEVPPTFFIMWGGGGRTTYNLHRGPEGVNWLVLDVDVVGLTRDNFSQIDVDAMRKYLETWDVGFRMTYNPAFYGLILQSPGDVYNGASVWGAGPDPVVDVKNFLHPPAAIDPVLGNGGTNYFTSSSSNVTLDFGMGDNTVWHGGDTFGETFTYARSDGNEVIDAFTSGGSSDVLRFTDMKVSDVSLVITDGVNLVATDSATGQTIRVLNQYLDATGHYGLTSVTFADGKSVDLRSPGTIQLVKAAGSNYLYDGVSNSSVSLKGGLYVEHGQGETKQTYIYHSGDGSSVINAVSPLASADTLSLADVTEAQVTLIRSGSDLLVEVASNGDILRIKNQFAGDDYGVGSIAFADGKSLSAAQLATSVMNGNDPVTYVTTSASNSTIFFTSVDQTFTHGPGTSGETYVYAKMDGDETLDLQTAAGSGDVLKFSDLQSSDVTATIVDGYNLHLMIGATGKSVTVLNEFLGTAGTFGLSNVTFEDGALTRGALLASATFSAPVGATYLYDPLSGTKVKAGLGDQYITHSKGEKSQTYLYAKGDGNDVISAMTPGGSSDVLKFTDLNATDVVLTKSGNDLLLKTLVNGQTIRVIGQFGDGVGTYGIASVLFANGRTYSRGAIAAVANGNSGGSYAPIIDGTVANQSTTDDNPVTPFSGVTVADPNASATESIYISFGGGTGILTDGSGFDGLKQTGSSVYTVKGSAAQVSAELRAMTFTPVGNQPNTSSTVTLSLLDTSTSGTSVSDSATTVIDKVSAVAPVIAGTAANQSAMIGAGEQPFAKTDVFDPNMGTTLNVSIEVEGDGTLVDGGQFSGLKSTSSPGSYTLSGTDRAVTAELQALTFHRESAGTSQISLSVTSSAGTSASDNSTSVVVAGGEIVAPTIVGTHQLKTTSEASVTPFSKVVVGDTNAGATDNLYITLYGSGTLADGAGFSGLSFDAKNNTYALSGTAAAISSELDALVFTPGAGPANTAYDTSFTLYVASSAGPHASDDSTTVTDVDPAVAPTISGTHHTTTTAEAPVTPFSGVTVGDANSGATDTLYINVYGNGSLADGAGFLGLTAGQGAGAYVLSGTAASITSELDALVLTPRSGGPGTAYDTTLVLYDASSAGPGAGDNATSVTDVDPAVGAQANSVLAAFATGRPRAVVGRDTIVGMRDLGQALNVALGSTAHFDAASGYGPSATTGAVGHESGAAGISVLSHVLAALHGDGHAGGLTDMGSGDGIAFRDPAQSHLHASHLAAR